MLPLLSQMGFLVVACSDVVEVMLGGAELVSSISVSMLEFGDGLVVVVVEGRSRRARRICNICSLGQLWKFTLLCMMVEVKFS